MTVPSFALRGRMTTEPRLPRSSGWCSPADRARACARQGGAEFHGRHAARRGRSSCSSRHCERVFVSVRADQRDDSVRAGYPADRGRSRRHRPDRRDRCRAGRASRGSVARARLRPALRRRRRAREARRARVRAGGRSSPTAAPVTACRSRCAPIYEPESAPMAHAAIAAGRHCPRKFVLACGVPLLDAAGCGAGQHQHARGIRGMPDK